MRAICGWCVRLEPLVLLLLAPLLLFPDPLRSLALLTIPLLWICRKIARGRFIDRTPLNLLVLLLVFMVLVSLYATFDIDFSLSKITGILLGIAIFYGVVHHCMTRKGLEVSLGLFLLGGVGVAFLSLIGASWPNKIPVFGEIIGKLPSLISGLPGAESGLHPNEIAGTLLWVIPLLWGLVVASFRGDGLGLFQRGLGKNTTRSLLLFGAAFVTLILLMTQSRSGYIGLGISFLLLGTLWIGKDKRYWRALLLVLIAGVLLYSSIAFGFGDSETDLTAAAFENPALSIRSMAGRVEIWSRAIYGIQDFPFTGMGLNAFRRVVHILYPMFTISPGADIGHAHNNFLQVALDLGVLGLITYIALHISSLTLLFIFWKRGGIPQYSPMLNKSLVLGLAGGLIAHLVFGMTDAIAIGAKPGILWWWMLGLIAALYRLQEEQEEQGTGKTGNRKNRCQVTGRTGKTGRTGIRKSGDQVSAYFTLTPSPLPQGRGGFVSDDSLAA